MITIGELLPWKGKWFKVVGLDGTKVVLEATGKKTNRAEKLDRKLQLVTKPSATDASKEAS